MPRKSRLDAPGVLHHVIIRGIERRKIFRSDGDRDDFVQRLERLLPETGTSCYGWALLPNHAHFLLRTGDTPLSTLMRRLLTGYAVAFNHRHNRHGQLFQNRYRSIICQEDVYLKELVRYIHLNPLRAGIVGDLSALKAFSYCGHGVLLGQSNRSWQDDTYVLSFFGETGEEARKHYLEFMKAGINQGKRPELVGGGLIRSLGGWQEVKSARVSGQTRIKGDQRILGESTFVTEVLAQAHEKLEPSYALKSKGYDLNTVQERVCETFHISPDEIYKKSRKGKTAAARGLYSYWAVRSLGYSLAEVGRVLGMTGQAVGYAVQRGERFAAEKKLLLTGETRYSPREVPRSPRTLNKTIHP